MRIPDESAKVVKLAEELVEKCTISLANRSTAYRNYAQFIETGRSSGGLSLANMLYSHIDRLSSHLFCPTDARFTIEFENIYPKAVLLQGEMTARTLTRAFNRRNFDISFAQAVWQALAYGSSFIKLGGKTEMVEINGKSLSRIKQATARVVPPWSMGVINEGRNDMENQEAILETTYLDKWDVWRRIAHMPERDKLYKRILTHSDKTGGPQLPASFIQVLSTSTLNIQPQGSNPPSPGGIIQMTGDPNYSTVGPQVMEEMFAMHELWCWDDEAADWQMIQFMPPDILVAPLFKRTNDFCQDCQPFILVQPNEVPGYFWGRSEIVDLTALQAALTETMDDYRRLIGVQYDKRLAFEGFDGDPAELFDDFRASGYVSGRAGAKVTDLTPSLPAEAITYIKLILDLMDRASGFGNILSGQGEPGVRAGVHANTLMKTASPRLRDRSLIVERNYAAVGDRYLSYMEAKDEQPYYTDPDKPDETSFMLGQIPDDRHVAVDSHSSSPIYENDHLQLTAFALKGGLIDGARAIDMLNIPDKDEAKREWKERAAAEQRIIAEHPELLTKSRSKR